MARQEKEQVKMTSGAQAGNKEETVKPIVTEPDTFDGDRGDTCDQVSCSPIRRVLFALENVVEDGAAMTEVTSELRACVEGMAPEELAVFSARMLKLKNAAERAYSITLECVSARG
jgi:hypothetical protein